jgi:hypothetical protein
MVTDKKEKGGGFHLKSPQGFLKKNLNFAHSKSDNFRKQIFNIWYFGPLFSRKSFLWVTLAFLFSPSWEILPQQKTVAGD